MSSMVCFFSRKKRLGGYRDDNKNVSHGYLGCSIAAEYFNDIGATIDSVGDSVLYYENEKGLPLNTAELYMDYYNNQKKKLMAYTNTSDLDSAFAKVWSSYDMQCDRRNPLNNSFRYLMTEERKNLIFDSFEEWTETHDEYDVELMKELLEKLKEIISEVDFEKENFYYAIG